MNQLAVDYLIISFLHKSIWLKEQFCTLTVKVLQCNNYFCSIKPAGIRKYSQDDKQFTYNLTKIMSYSDEIKEIIQFLPGSIFLQHLCWLSIQKQEELSTRAVISYQTNVCFGLEIALHNRLCISSERVQSLKGK